MLLRKFFHLPIDNENYYEMIYKVCPKIFSFFDKKKELPPSSGGSLQKIRKEIYTIMFMALNKIIIWLSDFSSDIYIIQKIFSFFQLRALFKARTRHFIVSLPHSTIHNNQLISLSFGYYR